MRDCEFWEKAARSLLAILLIGGFLCSEGWAQLIPLHVGHASINSRMSPLWIAAKEGFFRKQGLDVKVVNVRGGTQATQALLGGGLDMAYSDPPGTIAAIAAGAPLVEVMATATVMPYYLVGGSSSEIPCGPEGKASGVLGVGSFRLPHGDHRRLETSGS